MMKLKNGIQGPMWTYKRFQLEYYHLDKKGRRETSCTNES